jgi:hypothetical protein
MLEPPARSAAGRNNIIATDPTFRRLLGDAAWQLLNPNMRVRFAVKPDAGEVFVFTGVMDVVRRSWFGWLLCQVRRFIDLPLALGGDAYEYAADGRFHFHVEFGHPLTGLIVRYRGWLASPAEPQREP